jgi:hypothetical protein
MPSPSRRLALVAAILVIGLAITSCDASCTGHVDYTMPPADSVLVDAVAVVRGRVVGFPNVDRYTLDAELEVTEVLYQNTDGTSDVLTEGPLAVGAYDDPCERRTGLRFTDNDLVLVVLRWVGPDGTWDSPWHAFPVLSEDTDGRITFLDTQYNLNQRMNEIIGEPTVEHLIAIVADTG